MNREVLFRGKRIDNGEWIENDCIIHLKDRDTVYISAHKEGVTFEGDNSSIVGIANCMFLGVNPKTVGQYTGLTDKNGVKIFEGDILARSMYPFSCERERNYYAVVVCFENSPAFGIETVKAPGSSVSGISAGNTDYMEDWAPQCWEVIGNIYDNPELLST